MKGVILHGGHGTRLRPLTHTGPKQLLPIANKPMSQYALEDFCQAGIKDIGIIIGDVYPDKVKEFYGNGEKFGVNIRAQAIHELQISDRAPDPRHREERRAPGTEKAECAVSEKEGQTGQDDARGFKASPGRGEIFD